MLAKPLVGILALQGDFLSHCTMLKTLGVAVTLVKEPYQLQSINGLIIPGGESTAIIKQILQNTNWQLGFARIKEIQMPIFGTCAGLILLSKIVEPAQFSLGWLDISVLRNGYGRQINSHVIYADFILANQIHHIAMPLIRAPRIIKIGPQVTSLINKDNEIYLVEQENLLAATFHPEITEQTYIHQYFLQKIKSFILIRDGKM